MFWRRDHCGDQQIFQPEVRKQDHGADRKVDDAQNRVEDGNFEEHVEYEGEEEFEKLCHSFNTMQDSLAAGVDRAEEYDKQRQR